jgi:uncharacterized RDD family membrane protein YckC
MVDAPRYSGGDHRHTPADRMSRLGAQMLDGLVFLAAVVPAGIAVGSGNGSNDLGPLGIGLIVVTVIASLALLVINFRLISREGQTLGKKWSGIRIVRTDGSRASFGRIFGLRMIVNGLIGSIPILGPIYSLADSLAIFGEARLCLHDSERAHRKHSDPGADLFSRR